MGENKTMTYESEIMDGLNRLYRENRHIRSFKFFLDTSYRWFNREKIRARKPQVVVLGTGIPEELILAAGITPYYVLGGSLKSTAWSDDMVPRDTDPVSRSVLGFLEDPNGPDYSDALFIIPATSDSMRKIAYILSDKGYSNHVVDVPPTKDDLFSRRKWQKQMMKLTEAVSNHTGSTINSRNINQSLRTVNAAREALKLFLDLTQGREDIITGSGRMLVQSSYYYTENVPRWTEQLMAMNTEIRAHIKTVRKENAHAMTDSISHRPKVILMGSPIYFPNYKVPFLVEEIGLSISKNLDVTTIKNYNKSSMPRRKSNKEYLIRRIADRFLNQDSSSAYSINEVMFSSVLDSISNEKIEGVIYHVLKGQIEYDFELDRIEKLLDNHGIPVFRLETDYQYQDVEQLRIRMEAFGEMLNQNRYVDQKGRLA